MTSVSRTCDLLMLVADKAMEAAFVGILRRHQSLKIRPITFHIRVHPHQDSGCLHEGIEFLAAFRSQYRKSLLVFDYDGCGNVRDPVETIERGLDNQLADTPWQNDAAAIVLAPELETWIWSDSPHVARELGWKAGVRELRAWVEERGHWRPGERKPYRPKEAVEDVMRKANRPRSASVYQRIAEQVSLEKCEDRAFQRFRQRLVQWFPIPDPWKRAI